MSQHNSKATESIFKDFVGKYSLSKTLRFELKPVGKTLENMRNRFGYDKELQTFLCDQKIEDAYRVLKPVLDRIHENFITASLESDEANRISFGSYLNFYRNRKDTKEKLFEGEEKKLRAEFSKCFFSAAEEFKKSAGKNAKKKDILKESGFKVLTEAGIMEYVRKNAEEFSDILPAEEIREHLKTFSGFFTYFSGFNQNRENYYATKDEKKTAIATRIVHENLPTFCENILIFEGRKSEYESVYEKLKSLGKILEMKDGETGEMKSCISISPEVFDISSFNAYLSQCGIETYNEAISNANFLINLYNYNQRQSDRKTELKSFKTLYKQIGCGKRGTFIEAIACERELEKKEVTDESLESLFRKAADAGKKYFLERSEDGIIRSISDLGRYLRERESFEGIYWSKVALNTISSRYLANWHELQDRLVSEKVFKKAEKGSDERAKIPEAIELGKLFSVIDADAPKEWRNEGAVFRSSIFEDFEGERGERNKRYKEVIAKSSSPSRALLGMILSDMEMSAEAFVSDAENVLGLASYSNENGKESIKPWLDSMLGAVRIAQYFDVRPDKVAKTKGDPMESELAEGLKTVLHSADADWFQFYDLTRNFLTKKPQDEAMKNKLRLNFGKGNLLNGWAETGAEKKAQYRGYILRNREKYFLGISTHDEFLSEEVFPDILSTDDTDTFYEKLVYKKLDWAKNIVGGQVYSAHSKKEYGVKRSFKEGKVALSEKEHVRFIQGLLQERYLKKYPTLQPLINEEMSSLENLKQSFLRLNVGGMGFVHIKKIAVECGNKLINKNKQSLFLFEISSKDCGKKATGKKNLHSIYWEYLFSKENLSKQTFDLGAFARVFHRKQNSALKEKKLKVGYEGKPWIIEKKRFTKYSSLIAENRIVSDDDGKAFFFHCPIKINREAPSYRETKFAVPVINKEVGKLLLSNESLMFLGIDRGEKHLAYYSLVDSKGKLVEQGTLNIPFLDKDGNRRIVRVIGVDGKEYLCRDYNELLEARAGDRDFARKNWKTIGTIKELKNGYISQVVRRIVDIAVERGAFIVLENLSVGFMRGRQKIEKSVYQKLELALAKKLNFLVDKSAKPGEIGSVTRALQLTPPVNTFSDIKNQFGIMLYVRANYTSQTDPLTGWRKTVYLKGGSEEHIRKEIQDAFEDIRFDGKDYVFEYVEKIDKGKAPLKSWALYSGINGKSLDRFRGKNTSGRWEIERYDVAKMLETLFSGYDKKRSIREQMEREMPLKKIEDDPRIAKYSAYEQLRFAIDLIQQIRNTGKEGDERDADFLQSPVRSANGEHFDSRVVADKERRGETISLPVSGDANGAYNIARKGILMAEHIRRDGYKVYISDDEWAVWLDSKEKWIEWMRKNEKDLKRKEKSAE